MKEKIGERKRKYKQRKKQRKKKMKKGKSKYIPGKRDRKKEGGEERDGKRERGQGKMEVKKWGENLGNTRGQRGKMRKNDDRVLYEVYKMFYRVWSSKMVKNPSKVTYLLGF